MDCAGKGIYIGEFGERLRDYGYHMKDTNRGFFPFLFGRGNDYWPGVTPSSTYKYSMRKEQWDNNRGKVHQQKSLDYKNDLYEDMTQKINFAITLERTAVRKLIEQELSAKLTGDKKFKLTSPNRSKEKGKASPTKVSPTKSPDRIKKQPEI